MSVNLAKQYEQDKQRLIKYCFSRFEPDGTLHESYITHVRIIEDSHYPSSRPPPNSNGAHKKTRILSLAVKRSGTVRLHKGRENPNGSFQIGRTWNLDELTEIHIDNLSDCGLLVYLGKPYYWATNTPKERTVFIKSICNIYNKFTKGGLPVLVNFDPKVYGDIIALKNFGKPPILRYSDETSTSSSGNQNSHLSMASDYTRQSVKSANSPVAGAKQTFNVNSDGTLLSPLHSTSQHSQLGQHVPRSPITESKSQPSLQPKKSLGSIHQKLKMFEHSGNNAHPVHSSSASASASAGAKPKLTKIKTESSLKTQYQQPASSTGAIPPISFKSPRAASPMVSSPITASPLTDSPMDRSHLKNVLNSFENNGLDHTMDKSKNVLSPGKLFESPTHSTFSSDVKSNRSSIIDVEFKSKRSSVLIEPENDDEEEEENRAEEEAEEEEEEEEKASFAPVPRQNPLEMSSGSSYKSKINTNDDGNDKGNTDANIAANRSQALKSLLADDDDDVQNVSFEVPKIVTTNSLGLQSNSTMDSLDDFESSGVFDENIVEELGDKRQSMLGKDATPIEEIFEEIEWSSKDDSRKIEQKLLKNLFKTEYESVNSLINISSNFNEIDQYIKESIDSCEKLDPMLTFFQVELGGFSDEIEYIESQNNGLQVKTANKKVLWNDLKDIISNVSLSKEELSILTHKLSKNEIVNVEHVLVALYFALKTIRGKTLNNDLKNMRALTESHKMYEKYSVAFLNGVERTFNEEFKYIENDVYAITKRELANGKEFSVTDFVGKIDEEFTSMLIYSGYMLFAKETAEEMFDKLVHLYETFVQRSMNEIMRSFLKYNTSISNKIFTGEYKFSFDYKENKQNALRYNLLDLEFLELVHSKSYTSIRLLQNLILQQQSFLMSFFHFGSTLSFDEYVKRYSNPKNRVLNKPKEFAMFDNNKLMDRLFAKDIYATIKYLSEFSQKNMQILPLFMLLVDEAIEKMRASNNDYVISQFLTKIQSRFRAAWNNHTQQQGRILANTLNSNLIMESKIDILFVVKAYPQWIKFVEKSIRFSRISKDRIRESAVRKLLNATYEDYNKIFFKAFDGVLVNKPTQKGGIKDDIYVNLIINCHYLIESFDRVDIQCLLQFKTEISDKVYKDCIKIYVENLVQMHLSKLTEFLDGFESMVKSQFNPSNNNNYSKVNFQKLLNHYNKQEMFKGMKQVFKKIDTDYSSPGSNAEELSILKLDENDLESYRNKLIVKLWKMFENECVLVYKRVDGILSKYYRDVSSEVTRTNLVQMSVQLLSDNGFGDF